MKNYSINAKSSQEAELLIYGDIGESWWADESVTAKGVVTELQALDVSQLTVCINSYGGSVSDGLAIYNVLRNHKATIKVRIDGVAVSIASLIAMAGDTVEIAENAMIMIHAPWGSTAGNAKEMREYADLLDTYAEAMASSYVRKTGKPHAEILELLSSGEDYWFGAQQAVDEGFADLIIEDVAIAASGFKKSKFAETLKTLTSKGTEKMTPKSELEIKNEVLAAETKRRDSISVIFNLHKDREGVSSIKDACLNNPDCTLEQAQDKLLTKLGEGAEPLGCDPWRDDGYAYPGTNSHHDQFQEAAVDALLQRGGVSLPDPHPASRDLRGMTVLDIAKTCLEQGGKSSRSLSPNELVKASMTTSDFPLLLSNTASKGLQIGFEVEPATHRIWVRESETSDFKSISRPALSEAPALLKIGEGGEYKTGSLDERAESFKLETYGRILVLTRQAIINDDLTAFTRLPQAFGQSAARKEADLVYTILTSNPAMSDGIALFHANHKNLRSAATLSVAALGAARTAMRLQKGLKGLGALNITPRFLIVPAALESIAEYTIASLVDPAAQNNTNNLNWIRNLVLVVDGRLDASSSTGWYLAAGVDQIDTIEVVHLEGERVFVDSETGFSTDNFRLKCRLDFVAAAIDWTGMQYNPGA